jgi:DNA (cytosine-5)-methyltransferase 1
MLKSGFKEKYEVIDLFCGIGGLSHGFKNAGFNVLAGYDIDETCKFAFEYNNNAKFISKDIKDVTSKDIEQIYSKNSIKILVGCAPCQPFSNYSHKTSLRNEKWQLLYDFGRLIEEVQPDIVSMENVPGLPKFDKGNVYKDFIKILKKHNYEFSDEIVNCPDYGIPQYRKRFVLLASKLGKIELIPKTHTPNNYVTVEETIKKLEPLKHGEQSKTDSIHRASRLSDKNLKRIRQSVPGGTWRDWDEDLLLECHKKDSGKTYVSVYGRMEWKKPSPTMTTHCNGLGNGRFGHPEQDRAISLREAALFQTFPIDYQFAKKGEPFQVKTISTHIGNAVPPRLGEVIAKSIEIHLKQYQLNK